MLKTLYLFSKSRSNQLNFIFLATILILLIVPIQKNVRAVNPPSNIDTGLIFNQIAKLMADDTTLTYVNSIDSSGDTVIVSAHGDDDNGSGSGAAYVFERNQGGINSWGQVQKLTASDADTYDNFGFSVAISGDTIVVGAYRDDDAGSSSGSIYIFERNYGGANNWGEVTKILASDADGSDRFGISVAIEGDILVVGATGDEDIANNSGAVYVFDRNLGGMDNWGEVTKLKASDADTGDDFGVAVDISEDIIVVGAYNNSDSGPHSGSAYIFKRTEGGINNWGEIKKLTASDATEYDEFGIAVTVDGDTIAVGAYRENNLAGAIYVFNQNQGGTENWGQIRKLIPGDWTGHDDHRLGFSVDMNNEMIVGGAYQDNTAGSDTGSVYIFKRNEGGPDNWAQIAELIPDDPTRGKWLGLSVAIDGTTIVSGATAPAGSDSGAAYVFDGMDSSLVYLPVISR